MFKKSISGASLEAKAPAWNVELPSPGPDGCLRNVCGSNLVANLLRSLPKENIFRIIQETNPAIAINLSDFTGGVTVKYIGGFAQDKIVYLVNFEQLDQKNISLVLKIAGFYSPERVAERKYQRELLAAGIPVAALAAQEVLLKKVELSRRSYPHVSHIASDQTVYFEQYLCGASYYKALQQTPLSGQSEIKLKVVCFFLDIFFKIGSIPDDRLSKEIYFDQQGNPFLIDILHRAPNKDPLSILHELNAWIIMEPECGDKFVDFLLSAFTRLGQRGQGLTILQNYLDWAQAKRFFSQNFYDSFKNQLARFTN